VVVVGVLVVLLVVVMSLLFVALVGGLTAVILGVDGSGSTPSPEPVQQRHNLKICQNLHIPLK